MRAIANVMLANVTPEVKLEHKGETLLFSISVYGRDSFQKDYDVFDQINKFWADCTEEMQDIIFNLYKEISITFSDTWKKTELNEQLSEHVIKLMELHDLDTLQNWIIFKSDIIIPDRFAIEYEHSIDNNTSREKTYIRSDYVRLVTLSLAFRAMVPVWGEYISSTRQDSGTQFKEFYAFQLLNHSPLIHSLPVTKLKTYIENIVGADKYDPNINLNGISSEDFSFWLLSLVSIRRLCVGDIRGIEANTDLCTLIYKFIIQKIRNNDNNFENVIKEKKFDDKGPEGENKISTLERYKIKTNLSLGEVTELEYSLKDIRSAAQKLTSLLDPNILERSLQTCQELINYKLLDPQITLLRWVFKPVISPKGIMYLPDSMLITALGALEAVLWARGHKYLALLATSHSIVSDYDMVVSPVDSKKRVPEEMLAELDKIYPFKRTVVSKKAGVKYHNLTAKAIDDLADSLMMYSWRTTADESMIEEVFGSKSRKMPIKPDIKIDLTKLVIEIGSQSYI